MYTEEITNIIKSNKNNSYASIRRKVIEANIPLKDFQQVWRNRDIDESIDHNENIRKISIEIKHIGKKNKTINEWKDYFVKKGYMDDEVDLAYILHDSKINFNPFNLINIISLIIIVVIWTFVSIKELKGVEHKEMIIAITSAVCFFIMYMLRIQAQFDKVLNNIILSDFNADNMDKEQVEKIKNIVNLYSSDITFAFKVNYNKRETFYIDSEFIANKSQKKGYINSLIIQETKKNLPVVYCINSNKLNNILYQKMPNLKDVKLEFSDFNKNYKTYTASPTDAFYVLNPRVMSLLLNKDMLKYIEKFQTSSNYIIIFFTKIFLNPKIRLRSPIINFKDYIQFKSKIIKRLDLISDINAVLSRKIIDDGKDRNQAKNIY